MLVTSRQASGMLETTLPGQESAVTSPTRWLSNNPTWVDLSRGRMVA